LGIISGSAVFSNRFFLVQLYRSLSTSSHYIGIEGLYTRDTLPLQITSLLSYGLTDILENNKATISPIINNLEIKDDNLSYIFTLKDNLSWHNGKRLRTSDLIINIPHTQTSIISSNTLKISVSSPFSPLLASLYKPLFLKNSLIGLGKYKVENISYQDGYIKSLQLISSEDRLQKNNYSFYQNSDDLYNAFKLGIVDEISTTNLDEQLQGWPNIKIQPSISTKQYLAIFINTEKISNKQIRQAIAYATPKSDDNNRRCLGPIPPNSWAYNSEIKQYNYNPTRAKELFDINQLNKLDLVITDRKLLPIAESIKRSWEENLNIKVNLSIATAQINLSDYETMLSYSPISFDPDQYSSWHSTQTNTNITHFNNSRIDKLLEEGRLIQDPIERKKIYYDFQKFLLEESPAIFLEFPTTYQISRLK
jgi:peptide/nickel transport system substrate-binding protein